MLFIARDAHMSDKSPSEITRDTLMLLGTRKLVPNPANFRAAYCEVAGVPDDPPFPEEALRKMTQALPVRMPLHQKLKAQIDGAIRRGNWSELQAALISYVEAGGTVAAPVEARGSTELLEPIARLVENTLPALGTDDARIAEQATRLLEALRTPGSGIVALKTMLGNFNLRVSFAAEDQAEIRATLLKLLHLIIENIGALSSDDHWLKRQIDALMESATPPLSLRRLDDAERRIKDVMYKQTEAKGRALEAQEEMKRMVAMFIERLTLMTEATGMHHRRMEENARLIEQAKSFEDIAPVLKDLVAATRDIAQSVGRAHQEMREMRDKVQATEAEITRLHQELDSVSTQVRHDALTGALNRKGLDEAMVRELADVRRKETPLCVSLLDIDNFKKLNDTRGHATGDAALAHLSTVTRDSMRPQDTLARYGGEEFVVIMPDTELDQGVEAMTRLQRELTKRFFLAGDDKIVITFSAGVAQFAPEESDDDAIKRADQAMYLAKRAGKNRVVAA